MKNKLAALLQHPLLKGTLRASPLLLICLIAFAITAFLNPAKVGVAVWGLSKIAMGGYVGYWSDRWAFGDAARPHRLVGVEQGTAWKRRACIVAAAMIAAAMIP